MVNDELTYVKGFSQGYKLQRYSPEVFEKLKESLNSDIDFDRGLLDGAEEWTKEQEQSRLNELNQLTSEQEHQQDEELEQ